MTTDAIGMALTPFARSTPAAVETPAPVVPRQIVAKPTKGPSITFTLTLRANEEEQLAFVVAVLRALCEAPT